MAAKYLLVQETDRFWRFRIHLDVSRVNSQRQPDSAWVIERIYLKDMPLEQVEADLVKIIQCEAARRRVSLPGLCIEEPRVHPLSGRMV